MNDYTYDDDNNKKQPTPSDSTFASCEVQATAAAAAPNNSVAWMRQKIYGIMDEQRLHRLQQCQVLTSILKDCQNSSKNSGRQQLEDLPAGIRMVRYFDWRDIPSRACARETHAVWACRATALQCGADLAVLKNCFTEEAGIEAVLQSGAATAYETPGTNTSNKAALEKIPCLVHQQAMGQCVSQAATELRKRQDAQ